jgi:hypothetical protein
MGALLGEPGGVKEGSGYGHLFPWGPHLETWERAQMRGAYVWKKVLGRASLHIGAPLGDLGRGVHLPGTLRDR